MSRRPVVSLPKSREELRAEREALKAEALEQWVALARLMRHDDWRAAERCAAGEVDYIEPHDDWCVDADGCRSVLAYRDSVAAGLSDEHLRHIRGHGPLFSAVANGLEARGLLRVVLVDGVYNVDPTDFGREVARCLEVAK